MTYNARIIAGGKVVIPAAIRRELGLNDGDTVAIERDGDHVVLKSRKHVLREIQATFRALVKQPFTVDEFMADRQAEAERE